ncbi:uncharacterized protein LOC125670041 [Ostrea edulis]|uniref:uncharacterized protein LOC125670041 n=1 Tax=Ostrea edulis TaxID=37623 RepID=UPI0020958DC3|nr:uncharacterized protein LOC125670041 [Ostrea edulis]XP_048760911.1 uncharacterized protein LOC125670041 [Ostrea edulis]XP_048760912.1 uncharacterized protein LOC125670041 [Ostrea edulis]
MKHLRLLSRIGVVFGSAEVGLLSAWTKRRCRCLSTVSSNVNTVNDNHTEENYKRIMRKVPQCVLVVTAAEYNILRDCWIKRGMTCTSFTNVSYQPPIVSICINNPSHMHELLLRTQKFAIHVLKQNQVRYGLDFSKHVETKECQFEKIPHVQTNEGIPIISGCAAVMECRAHSVHTVGDHHVWYGSVVNARTNETEDNPLLYYTRSFRSVGDEIFIQAFEDATLPFEDWTHEAHLRMAWNYITEHGREGAIPHIRLGIQRFNEQNKDKVKFGFHETITRFYIAEVAYAINHSQGVGSFEAFLDRNHYLLDKTVISQYYSHNHLYSDTARHQFVQPDLKPLPN